MTLALDIPTLETERLTLRAPAEADFPALAAFYETDRAEFVGGHIGPNEVWRTLASMIGHWALRGYGMWAVDERETGLFCGHVGPWNPHGWPEPEIGWTLLGAAEGRGIAREAAEASRAYAYGSLGWTTAISLIDPANTRSIRLAERMGARLDYEFQHDDYGLMHAYRHPSPQELAA